MPISEKLVDSIDLRGISEVQRFTTDQKGFRITKDVNYEVDTTFRVFAVGGSRTQQVPASRKQGPIVLWMTTYGI